MPPRARHQPDRRRRSASPMTRRIACASAGISPGSTSRPASGGTVSGIAPAAGADDGQAVRDSLGIGHAIAFEMGGERRTRRLPRRAPRDAAATPRRARQFDFPARDARYRHQAARRHSDRACGRRQSSAATADRRASPALQSARQNPCAARRRRPTAAARRRPRLPCANGARIAARPRDGDVAGRHAVIGSDQPCRGRAGDDDALHGCERRALACA